MKNFLLPVEVVFSVLRDGYYAEVSINETFDTSDDMYYQAKLAADAWINRQVRIFGNQYTLNKLINAHYSYNGKWYSQLSWCIELL